MKQKKALDSLIVKANLTSSLATVGPTKDKYQTPTNDW